MKVYPTSADKVYVQRVATWWKGGAAFSAGFPSKEEVPLEYPGVFIPATDIGKLVDLLESARLSCRSDYQPPAAL
jgi:hypothetical protein